MAYNTNYYRTTQTARLLAALLFSFRSAQFITLRFDNDELPQKIKTNDIKNLLHRTHKKQKLYGADVRYILVPEYATDGADVKAYHVFTDMSPELCADVFRTWSAGEYSISTVDVRQLESLPRFMFDPSSVRKDRMFFTSSRSVSRALSA